MSGIVFIISAPSGSGKTTLTNELRKIVPNLEFSISYTTRTPRGSEQNGREYFFVSREVFNEMKATGEFLEYAEVFANCYGTARRFLGDARGCCGREHERHRDAEHPREPRVLRRRLQTAAKEIENYNLYDYIVVNDRLEKSTDELKAIVLSERLRRSGAKLSRQRELLETAERCRLQNAGERVRDIVASFALSAAPSS